MTRIVIDTNVLVSALLTERGAEAAGIALVYTGQALWCVSEPIIEEYRAVLARPKFARVRVERVQGPHPWIRREESQMRPRTNRDGARYEHWNTVNRPFAAWRQAVSVGITDAPLQQSRQFEPDERLQHRSGDEMRVTNSPECGVRCSGSGRSSAGFFGMPQQLFEFEEEAHPVEVRRTPMNPGDSATLSRKSHFTNS